MCRGPKVEALAANLLGDMEAITVDRHIVMAATDGQTKQVWASEMRRIALMLELLAKARHVSPAVLMAAYWLRQRRSRSIGSGRGRSAVHY